MYIHHNSIYIYDIHNTDYTIDISNNIPKYSQIYSWYTQIYYSSKYLDQVYELYIIGYSSDIYPLVNKLVDPEHHQFLMETSLPTPMTARVYVNLPEGTIHPSYIYIYPDWCFFFYFLFFQSVGNVIIPTDFHIFQRGWNHQPVYTYIYIWNITIFNG